MSDDWRLQIDFEDEGPAGALMEHLDARELEHDLSEAFDERVIVSRDGDRIFLYAGSRDQAESARRLIESLAGKNEWQLSAELRLWHAEAEDWEDPDAAAVTAGAEHDDLIARERSETDERGYPEVEVRVDLSSRDDAARLEQRLGAEGLPAVRRGKYLLVGATDEDSAAVLAKRLREEAPADSEVKVEGTWKAALAERPANPFAIFGGLGG